jgi:hypothetical protein
VRAKLERTTSAEDLDHAFRYSMDRARDVHQFVFCENYPGALVGCSPRYRNRALRHAADAQKVGEEGMELVLAGVGESEREIIAEAADLLYHTLLLTLKHVSFADQ